MKKMCTIVPTVKVGNKEVESKLFRELTTFTNNRESTKNIWALTQIPAFMNTLKGIEYDENGEPTLESLNKALNITKLLEGNTSLLEEKRSLGAITSKGTPVEFKRPEEIIDKVIEFNKNNTELVASIETKNSNYIIDVNRKTSENFNQPNDLMFQNSLNNKLRGIMRSLGFDVEIKEDTIYDGIFNPLNAKTTVDGLKTVIQIAQGIRGEEAFPEEFSHFIIEGLSSEPLVERLVNNLSPEMVEKILGEEYTQYVSKYNNTRLLQKEAAAKILQSHIIKQEVPEQSKNLVQRLWNMIKTKFKRLTMSDIDRAINDANNEFAKLASNIVNDSILPKVNYSNIINGDTLYKLGNEVNKLHILAEDAVTLTSKRMRLMMLKSKNSQYSMEDLNSVKDMQELIAKKEYAKSSLYFLANSLNEIEKLSKQLDKLRTIDTRKDSDLGKVNSVSKVLRNIKEFSDAYDVIIKQMMSLEVMRERGEVDLTEEDARIIANKAADINKIITNINSNYNDIRFNTVFNFLKIYWGEDKMRTLGKNRGELITLEMILTMADKDINAADRWISTLSAASDPLLSLMDKVFKTSMMNRDTVLEDVLANIRGIQERLTKAGYNSEFMYERDSEGNLTGRIISDIDFAKFNKNREEYIKYLDTVNVKYHEKKARLEAWERDNMEPVKIDFDSDRIEILPKKDLYGIDTISKLSPAQRSYYNDMMKAKIMLDQLLPNRYTNTYNAVQIRNDMIEVVSNNLSDPKDALKIAVSGIKDRFLRRSDDTEFGEILGEDGKKIILDLSGKPIQKLPIYYTRPLEDISRLSTDFSSTLLAYAGMAINYHELNKIVDALELTRDLIQDREVQEFSGDKRLVETYKILNKQYKTPYMKRGSNTNIGSRLDDYYASNLYGQRKKDHGSFKVGNAEVDIAKLADEFKNYTSLVGMGLNTFSTISNVLIGEVQAFIEGIGNEFFSLRDMATARKDYHSMMPKFLSELNSINKSNKLDLLINKFDALESFHDSLKREGFYKNSASRLLGNTGVFIGQQAGEHYLHTTTMLAMLNRYKVKNKRGLEMPLFKAYSVNTTVENGVTIYKLELDEGITKLDGTPFTQNDFHDLKLKIKRVNQSLNGAFSDEDKGAFHRQAIGRLVMQFRQWMPEHYQRRFSKQYYDSNLDQDREGYYITMSKFMFNLIKDLSKSRFEIATKFNSLSEHEKANLRKASAEIGIFIALSILISMLGPAKDKKGRWSDRMILYQLQRMKLEVGASTPITPEIISNIFTIIQQPAAAVKISDNLINLVMFWNMFNEIESGRYKGWSEWERDFVMAMPLYSQIKKVADLSEEDYLFTLFNK